MFINLIAFLIGISQNELYYAQTNVKPDKHHLHLRTIELSFNKQFFPKVLFQKCLFTTQPPANCRCTTNAHLHICYNQVLHFKL